MSTPNNEFQPAENYQQNHSKLSKRLSWPLILSGGALFFALAAFSMSFVSIALPSHTLASRGEIQLIPSQVDNPKVELTGRYEHELISSRSSSIVADVAEEIAPSVVNIDIKKEGKPVAMVPFGSQFFNRFFGTEPVPFQQIPMRIPEIKGNGSGIIISSDGLVLTNNHVVANAQDIEVTVQGGKTYPAKVVGRDPFSDIAVIQMQGAHNLKPAKLGSSKHLRPGDWVIAVGSPLGFDHTVTFGIVSALSRQIPDINANVSFIQTDAAINPGNSGGPLVTLDGDVVGINTAIAGSGQNIGFAIPVDIAKKVSQELISDGHITRPWIGISMAVLTQSLAKSLGIPENVKGVIVAQVLPNSPSDKAGFQQGDVIQRLNGSSIETPQEIQKFVRSKPIGTEFNFQILRNGQMMALSLKTDTLPDTYANPAAEQ